MPESKLIQTAFVKGQYSPRMDGRVDVEGYRNACKRIENFIVFPQGGAIARSGSKYIANTKTNGAARLIPFVISTVSAYVVEIGNGYMRFYKAGAKLPVEIISPYLTADLFELDFAQTNDVMYFAHTDHAPRKLSRISDTEWMLHEVNFDTEPLIDDNFLIDTTGAGMDRANSIAFEKDKTTRITTSTPFISIDGDIGRIISQGQKKAKILWQETGGTAYMVKVINPFSNSDFFFTADELRIIGTPFGSLNPSAAGGVGSIITLTSNVNGNTELGISFAAWVESGVGNQYYINSSTTEPDEMAWHGDFLSKNNDALTTVTGTHKTGFSNSAFLVDAAGRNFVSLGVSVGDTIFNTTDGSKGTITGIGNQDATNDKIEVTLAGGTDNDFDTADVFSIPINSVNLEVGEWAYGDIDGLGFDTIYIRTPTDTDPSTFNLTQDKNAILRVDDTGSAAELFREEDKGKFIQINSGLVEITTFVDATSVRGRVLQTLDSADATIVWTLLTSYWDSADYPGAVVFHENRLVFGGSPSFPNTFWGSEVGQYEKFQPGVADGDSYAFTLNARKASLIRWLESRDVMIAGLEDSEWQIGFRNAIITPSSIFVRRQTIHGCANIQSVVAEKSILFVERGGNKIRELNFDFESDSYIAADKTLLSEDIGGASGFKQMDVQNRPFPVIWAVNNDGQLVGMTYIKNQNLQAWHVHETGATAAGAVDGSDEYESVAVIPNLTDETVDEVWVVVKRTINGSPVRFVERFEKPLDIDAAVTDPRMLDAFTLQETTSTTVSGLDRFDGDVVTAIRDGDPDKISTHTVVAGSITIVAPVTNVVVGLPYKALIQTMRANAPGPIGTSQAQIQRISKVWLRLFNTLGLKCGATEAGVSALNLEKSSQVNEDDYYTFADNGFFEGDVEFEDYAGGSNRQNFVFIVQDQPLPATVTALIMEVDTT